MSKQAKPMIKSKKLGLGGLLSSKAMPYLIMPLICVFAMPVALLAHWQWGNDPAMTTAMGISAVLITGYTHITWSRRHEHTRNTATLATGGVSGWIVFAAATDPTNRGMVNAWALGGLVLSAVWDIRYASLSTPHETDKSAGEPDTLMSKIQSLTGARTKKVKETEGRIDAKVQLKPGEATVSDVQADKDRIASAVGMGADQVTVTPVKGRADQVRLSFQITEGLKDAVSWTGLSAPGTSVADSPLMFGQRANGNPLGIWVCGKEDAKSPRPLSHGLCTGQTGSGKTETVVTIILEGRSRIDFVPIVGDPAKFAQGFGAIADCLAIAAKTKAQVNQLIRNIPDAIAYRSDLLGSLERPDGTIGYSQWEPECYTARGIPLVFIDIEEATDVLSSSDDEMYEAIRKARSVGIFVMVSLQSAGHTDIDRKTRGQFGQSLCHGVGEDMDAKFALNPNTRAAGADPTKWSNQYPGSLFAEVVGDPREDWAVEARTAYIPREEKRRIISETKPNWAKLDPGTAMYLERGITVPDEKLTAPLPAIKQDAEEDEENVFDLTGISTEEGVFDVTQPIPEPTHDVHFPLNGGEKKRGISREAAQALIEQRIDELETAGADVVTFADLADLKVTTGYSRGWVYGELNRLVQDGRLTQENGKPPYRIRARMLNGSRVT